MERLGSSPFSFIQLVFAEQEVRKLGLSELLVEPPCAWPFDELCTAVSSPRIPRVAQTEALFLFSLIPSIHAALPTFSSAFLVCCPDEPTCGLVRRKREEKNPSSVDLFPCLPLFSLVSSLVPAVSPDGPTPAPPWRATPEAMGGITPL